MIFKCLVLSLAVSAAVSQLAPICPGAVGDNFLKIAQMMDGDGDGEVMAAEFDHNMRLNFDEDGDGCVTQAEWNSATRHNSEFSDDFDAYVFTKISIVNTSNSADCIGIDYKSLRGVNMSLIATWKLMSNDIQSLLDFCKTPESQGNCDCEHVKTECVSSFAINGTLACRNYQRVVQYGPDCDGKGELGDRLIKTIDVSERDQDGRITGLEMYADFHENYDTNQDGCVSQSEFVNRWTSYFGFSAAYAIKRWQAMAGNDTQCPLRYDHYKTDGSAQGHSAFLQAELQTLVDLCLADPQLAGVNCDCGQLAGTCRTHHFVGKAPACRPYLADGAATVGR